MGTRTARAFAAPIDRPLIGIPLDRSGREEVLYFTDDDEADEALQSEAHPPIKLAGIWSDLDADEMLAALDDIRHASKPTPPIEDI